MLGVLYRWGDGVCARNDAQAVAFHLLAAAQGLDAAQYRLGIEYYWGSSVECPENFSVVEDYAEALRFFHLAAAQGYSKAMEWVASFHESGIVCICDHRRGGRKNNAANKAAAIRWYRLAQAAGDTNAADALLRLLA